MSYVNAATFGFSPRADGMDNVRALQQAVDRGGDVEVTEPGIYEIAATVYIGSDTSLKFAHGVFLKKTDKYGKFTHVFLNKGALSKTYDSNIVIEGLHLIVNGVDKIMDKVYGLRGQIAFFYIKDLRIEHFRCMDFTAPQFCIHICTFEDVIINDVILKGNKDGIHFGNGRRFTVSNGVFQTIDDAIALNAKDYATSNPEVGDIQDGIIEKCRDLDDGNPRVGFFCRLPSGGWIDWRKDMEVRHSDTVISEGRLYRVQAPTIDGKVYTSLTRPVHASGQKELDGIRWGMVQDKVIYQTAVRNIVFRDISLEKPRRGFGTPNGDDKYDRSYYPGSEIPVNKNILLDNVRVTHDSAVDLCMFDLPVENLAITNSVFKNNGISFCNSPLKNNGKTFINITGCTFAYDQTMTLIENTIADKQIVVVAAGNIAINDGFRAELKQGGGKITLIGELYGK